MSVLDNLKSHDFTKWSEAGLYERIRNVYQWFEPFIYKLAWLNDIDSESDGGDIDVYEVCEHATDDAEYSESHYDADVLEKEGISKLHPKYLIFSVPAVFV